MSRDGKISDEDLLDAIAVALANARAIRSGRAPRSDILVCLSADELEAVLDDARAALTAVKISLQH